MDSKHREEESFDPYDPSYADKKHPSGPPAREPSPFADPPPSYALSEATASSSRNAAPATTISRTPHGPNTTYGPSQDLILHVYNTGSLFNRQWTVTLPDKSSAVYVISFPIRLFSTSNPVTFQRGSENGPLAGTAQFHAFSNDMDIAVFPERPSGSGLPVAPITAILTSSGIFTRQHSLSLFGRNFWIKGTHQVGSFGSLKFVDDRDVALAVYASTVSWDKIGRVEIMVPGLDSAMVDAIVISLLSLAERERERRRRNGAIAGGAGA